MILTCPPHFLTANLLIMIGAIACRSSHHLLVRVGSALAVLIATATLLITGAAKIDSPWQASRTFGDIFGWSSPLLIRGVGGFEVVLGFLIAAGVAKRRIAMAGVCFFTALLVIQGAGRLIAAGGSDGGCGCGGNVPMLRTLPAWIWPAVAAVCLSGCALLATTSTRREAR